MHTAQRLERGPRTGAWVYTGGNRRMGRYVQCCSEAWIQLLALPAAERDTSAVWAGIGHDTRDQAYAHMRERLLERLRLDTEFSSWGGCGAPVDGGECDEPTKRGAQIPPCHFLEHLCDRHRTREVVEAMWNGPGDWSGSW